MNKSGTISDDRGRIFKLSGAMKRSRNRVALALERIEEILNRPRVSITAANEIEFEIDAIREELDIEREVDE